MKLSPLAGAPLLVGFLLAGCGGGGSNPGGTNDPDVSTLSNVRVDAILSGSSAAVDPNTIFPGESVRFRLTGLDNNGQRVFVNVNGWRATAPPGVGSIAGDGTFSAGSAGAAFSVSVTIRGVTYSANAQVVTPQAIVRGLVRTLEGRPAGRILVRAYDANGAEVGNGYSATDGTLRLSISPSATRFSLDFSAVDPSGTFYVRQFAYLGTDYSTTVPQCWATLPALANGSTSTLGSDVVVYLLSNLNPPPPPDGCGPIP